MSEPLKQSLLPMEIPEEVTLPTALVTVKKRAHEVPVEVPHHEVPILRAAHLDESVVVVDATYGTVTLPNNPLLELSRLRNKYDRPNAEIVGSVYPNPDAIARATGMDLLAGATGQLLGETVKAPESLMIDPGESARRAASQAAAASTRTRLASVKK